MVLLLPGEVSAPVDWTRVWRTPDGRAQYLRFVNAECLRIVAPAPRHWSGDLECALGEALLGLSFATHNQVLHSVRASACRVAERARAARFYHERNRAYAHAPPPPHLAPLPAYDRPESNERALPPPANPHFAAYERARARFRGRQRAE